MPMPPSIPARWRATTAAAALALAAAVRLAAQQPMTLQEAIARAQAHSHQARAARAAHEAARYRDRAFQARLLPQLSLSGTVPSYNRSIVQVLQVDTATGNAVTLFQPQAQTSTAVSLLLSQTLPLTGGSLFVSSSLTKLSVSGQGAFQTWSSTPVTMGLRQDILRPNVAGWNRREQTALADEQERTYRRAMEDVAAQTTGLFFAAYAARKGLDNAVTNAAVNDTLYRLNTGRFRVGRIGENDLLQSQLALLRARTSLDAARLEYDRATAQLRLGLGLPSDQPLEVAVTATVPDLEPDTLRAVAEALRNAVAVGDLALAEVQARRRVAEAQLADGVGATVQASYGYNATAPSMHLAYQNLLEARTFSLAVQVPLWQWGAHGAGVKAAEADRDRVTAQSASTLEQLALDAKFAALDLSQARRNVALLTVSDSVAGKRFEVAYNRYVIGKITIDNLYIAQQEKDAALAQFVGGLRDYWLAYYRLRQITLYDFAADQPIR
jgi:outer membrane protein